MSRIYTHPLKQSSEQLTGNGRESAAIEVKLPADAEVLRVHVSSSARNEPELFRFGENQKQLVYVAERFCTSTLNAGARASDATLTLVMIPHHGGVEATKLVQLVQIWAEATISPMASSYHPIKSILLTLQGVQVIWQADRAIVFAEPHRMDLVCQALIEATYYEQELRRIEGEIDSGWEQTQADSALAFEFNEQDLPLKESLSKRFQDVLALRVHLARLVPQILVPHVYPPTIASQIGERLRERTRMPERLELIEEKLSAQEQVYDHCTQRAGEYIVARKGHILEWIIIALLFLQTLLWIVDFLASSGQ
jgi:hypothetical protein